MNKKQYNNVIDWTLKHEARAQSEDSLQVTRAICNELGVALPQGDLAQVAEVLATDDYMGWKACTQEEAQEAVNNGIPAIGISNDQIVMLAADDEEQPVANAFTVMTLASDAKAMSNSVAYYSYGCGTTCVEDDTESAIEEFHIISFNNVMHVNEYRIFQIHVMPEQPNGLHVVWHSSDSSVIAITDAGEAWARKVGKAQLSVETADGQHRDTIDMEVIQRSDDISSNSKYKRENAVAYARKYAYSTGPDYVNFGDPVFSALYFAQYGVSTGLADCANFVSQCLVAGGLEMNDDWYFYQHMNTAVALPGITDIYYRDKNDILVSYPISYYFSAPWTGANAQYEYFSNTSNGYTSTSVVKINSVSSISNAVAQNDIKPGDLMYFSRDGGKTAHHATIISSVADDDIMFCAHTEGRKDQKLTETMENESVIIVRLNG